MHGIAAGLALLLAASGPPDQAPIPEPSRQQSPPGSWTPENGPGQASAYRHETGLVCRSSGPEAASKQFVESINGATVAFKDGRLEETIRLLEIAAAHARSDRQWMGIEEIRILTFSRVGNDPELIASLEVALSAKGCLSEDKAAEYQQELEAARKRVKFRQ